MPFDDLVRNPLLRRALEVGEERVTRAMTRLLATVNLPSKDDVVSLRKKLDELEKMIDGLAERVDRDRGGGR
jgi:hypothetical protein